MMKRRRLLLSVCGLIFAAGLALGLGRRLPPVYANVTLESFTATYLPGTQEVRIDWKTATELDTSGFYITRSNSATGPFAQVSPFIPHEGDTISGWTYVYTDVIPALNRTYYYFLEAVNNDQSLDPHGPIAVAAGIPSTKTPAPTLTPTQTRTLTLTPTRTRTPTPSATPTTQPSTDVSVPSDASDIIEVTPRLATGETITPQPTVASQPPSPVVHVPTSSLASAPANSQPTAPSATSKPPLGNTSPLATVAPPPTDMNVLQAPASALVPAEAAPGVAAPVVVATEAASPAASTDSTHGDAFILVVAAILFLGIAFVILRQARQ